MNLTPQQQQALRTWINKGINSGWQAGDTIGQIASPYDGKVSNAEKAHINADRQLVQAVPALKGKTYAEVKPLCS